jgi:hypothetical protein
MVSSQINGFDPDTEQRDILKLSHGVAVVLLFSEFWAFAEAPAPEVDSIFAPKYTFRTFTSSSSPTRTCTMTRIQRGPRQLDTLFMMGQAGHSW